MNQIRLTALHQFYEEDPHDPFNVYALAIEYVETDAKKSKKYFDELLEKYPDYLATYYHAAALYGLLGDVERTIALYKTGIDLAINQQNRKTLQELQRAYQSFLDEEEE